jgi:hypothetical protein
MKTKQPIRSIFVENAAFSDQVDLTGVSELSINLVGAQLAIIGTTENSATLRVQGRTSRLPQWRVVGTRLELVSQGLLPLFKQKEGIKIELLVPSHLVTTVKCWAGALWLENLRGPIKIKLGAGSIEGHNLGETDVKCRVGSVFLDGLNGSSKVCVGVGEARLSWERFDQESRAHCKVWLGGRVLQFPQTQTLPAPSM